MLINNCPSMHLYINLPNDAYNFLTSYLTIICTIFTFTCCCFFPVGRAVKLKGQPKSDPKFANAAVTAL